MKKNWYRLPNGEWTKSAVKMSREWAKIYKPIEKALHLTATGFDPSISFREKDAWYNSFQMPTEVAMRITALINENNNLKKTVQKRGPFA